MKVINLLQKIQQNYMEKSVLSNGGFFAKGGKVLSYKKDFNKFKKIGINDKYAIEAINEIGLQGLKFDSESINNKIEKVFNELLDGYSDFLISEDSDSITNYIKNEIEALKENGNSLDVISAKELELNDEIARRRTINEISSVQKDTISTWVDYLKQSEYSIAFKLVMLRAILNYNYDLKQNKIFERSNKTIRNFTPFDAGVLSELHESESDNLLVDYVSLLNEKSKNVLTSRETIEQSGDGRWIKFNGGKKTPIQEISTNANELTKLVQNTYWCTKSRANSQLVGGDFYVYVTDSEGEIYPRIAIRMNENEVGEVRGNRSSAQDLEDDMLTIAEDFLKKNIPNNSGIKWLNSIKFNKKCSDFRKRIEKEGLFKDFFYEYIEIMSESNLYNVDYGGNGNAALLKEIVTFKINELPNEHFDKDDIVFDYYRMNKNTQYYLGSLKSDAILFLNSNFNLNGDFSSWKLKAISSHLDASNLYNLGNIEFVGGSLDCGLNLRSFSNLKYVGETLYLRGNSNLKSLEKIESIGNSLFEIDKKNTNSNNFHINDLGNIKYFKGDLSLISCDETFDFGKIEVVEKSLTLKDCSLDLKNLSSVSGDLIVEKGQISDLKKLSYVGRNFNISGSKVKVFSDLKFIGGNAFFNNNFSSSTQKIEVILGDLSLLNSRIIDFSNLVKVGGTIEFTGSYVQSLNKIKYVGGNLNFQGSKIEDLGDLEYVGGWVNFSFSKIENLNKLKTIIRFVNFENSNVKDLGDLQVVGGNAYFKTDKINSLGKLKKIGGFTQFTDKELEKKWLKIKDESK